MSDKRIPRIAVVSLSNQAKALTRRPANHARHCTTLKFTVPQYLGCADIRYIGVQQFGFWEIIREGTAQLLIDVNADCIVESGAMRA